MGLYKTRTEFLNKSIIESTSEDDKRLLSVGFIPESYKGEYERYMAKSTDQSPDVDLDRISNANHFALVPNRVFGNVVAGSGFLNPILVKGTINDVVQGLNHVLTKEIDVRSLQVELNPNATKEEVINALTQMAANVNHDKFIENISQGFLYDIDVNSPAFKESLQFVSEDPKGNLKKLSDFYYTIGRDARRKRRIETKEAVKAVKEMQTESTLEDITKTALKADEQMWAEINQKELSKQGISIKSARKYKSTTCIDGYNFVEKQQEYCYEVIFSDKKHSWYGNAPTRHGAIRKAIADRLEKTNPGHKQEQIPNIEMAQLPIISTAKSSKRGSEDPQVNFTTADLVTIQRLNLIDEDTDEDKSTRKKTITVEESIEKYNPGISRDEIMAWVWYKRQFGNPMKGWDKYFMGGKSDEINILVKTTRDTTVKDNAFRDLNVIPENVIIGKRTKFSNTYGNDTYVAVRTETNELILVNVKDIKDIKNRTEAPQEEIDRLVKVGVLIYDGADYFPVPVFLFGDIYKRLRSLRDNVEAITKKYGVELHEKQMALVDSYRPKMRSFREKVKSLRPHILSLSSFAMSSEQFGITTLNDEAGVKLGTTVRNRFRELEEKISLFEAFQTWFRETVKDTDLKGTTKVNVATYYWAKSIRWEKDDKGKDKLSQAEKDERVGAARMASEDMFSEFLATALTYEDSVKLDVIWNEKYNAFTNINQFVDKVPVAYAGSTMFKNGSLAIRSAQRHGLAFLQLTGSGCVSYDVGFGKTLVGILNLAQLMSQGRVKRPLIVVPKPTYKNWLRELFGYWSDGERTDFKEFKGSMYHYGILSGTNIKLNDWFNLSGEHFKTLLAKNKGDLNSMIPENTITVVSYKGFEQMGFSRDVSDELINSIAAVLQQKETFKDVKEELGFMENVKGWLGLGNKNAVVMVDKVGFDHITVDEAHNFKNVFAACGKDPDTGRKLFGISGSQSTRAVKMFFVTQFLQRNHGKNVVLLTATPFTNSPLEMYSMLSFIGLDTLNNYNLYNIKKFFENFILETIEYAINVKGEIITKPVIKSFKNLKLLQTILYNHFDYKDNPKEAGVVRPCLVELPNKDTTTYIEMNEWQKKNQAGVRQMAASVSRNNPGAVLKAISMSLDNAFSPYLYSNEEPESAEEFVKNSPKIQYAIECIKSVKDWHELRNEDVSGQIIYSNRGKEYFEYIKEFLCSKAVGFKRNIQYDEEMLDEVEIITGGGSEADQDRKELIKDAFNAGIVKIIIGTGTIREGINLQTRGTVIYDLYPEWNPTDIHQLKGRIWRQGNKFGYVRFVMPLVINSMDNFIYQKQDEKSKRISSLWNSLGDTNVEEVTTDLDPSEIKYELVEDPTEKFKIKHESEYKEAERALEINKEKHKLIAEIDYEINELKEVVANIYGDLKPSSIRWAEYLNLLKTKVSAIAKKNDAPAKYIERINLLAERTETLIKDFNDFEGSNKSDVQMLLKVSRDLNNKDYYLQTDYSNWQTTIKGMIEDYEYEFSGPNSWQLDKLKGFYATVRKAERSVLTAYDLAWTDDLTKVNKDLLNNVHEAEAYLAGLNEPGYKQKLMEEIAAEIEAKKALRGSLHDQVNKFIALNYLLSYLSDNTDKDKCKMPTESCCETLGLDVIYKETTPRGEVVEEKRFEEKVYSTAEYESLLKGLKAMLKLKAGQAEGVQYEKMVKAIEAIVKIKKKHDAGGVLRYNRGGGMGPDKLYTVTIEFDPNQIDQIKQKIEDIVKVSLTDDSMFSISDNEITISGLSQKEESLLADELMISEGDINYQSQEQSETGQSCGCGHDETGEGQYNNGGQMLISPDQLREHSHGFSGMQIKKITEILKGINEGLTGKIDSWGSGGNFYHIAVQLNNGRWVIFSSASGDVTMTSIPYTNEADVYEAWGSEPEKVTSLIIDGLEDENFMRTNKIINSIKDGTFVDLSLA